MTSRIGALGEFKSAMRAFILRELPHPPRDAVSLQEADLPRLATLYFTWQQRQVSNRPRQILMSTQLQQHRSLLAQDEHLGLDLLLRKLAVGDDVRPHLSTDSACGYDGRGRAKPGRYRKDLDRLLGAWGLHHFHLSTGLRSDGWAERSKHVLIARVEPDRFVAVAVVPHGQVNDPLWTVRPDLLEIIAGNWTEAEVSLNAAPAGYKLSRTYTPQELLRLRNAGVSVLVEVMDRVCMPGAIAADGTPMAATRRSIDLIQLLEHCEVNKSEWAQQARAALLQQSAEPVPASESWAAYLGDDDELRLVWSQAVDVVVSRA